MTPLSDLIYLLEQPAEVRGTLVLARLLKDVIKDRALDEETQRMGSGTVPSTEASVPAELGASPF